MFEREKSFDSIKRFQKCGGRKLEKHISRNYICTFEKAFLGCPFRQIIEHFQKIYFPQKKKKYQ